MRQASSSSRSASLLRLVLFVAAVSRGGEAFAGQTTDAAPFGESRVLTSGRGMVVSASAEASRAGAGVLTAGGNAMDAAVATALALAVAYPPAGNLAGGGFLVVRTPDGVVRALDFRETAPARASRVMFLGRDGRPVARASTATALAVATPGSVRGYAEAHRLLGRLPWEAVVAPAVRLAREGFRVPPGLAREMAEERDLLSRWEETRRIFFREGTPLEAGSVLRQPDLATTLERIGRSGPDAFHRGEIARRIVAFVRAQGGVLTAEDLAGYQPVWRAPEEIRSGRLVVFTMPLPSSAGLVLRSVLAQLDLAEEGRTRGLDAGAYHALLEAERRAFADRNRWLGDADCIPVPLAELVAPARLAALAGTIDPRRATPSTGVRAGVVLEREETTHLSVATPDGFAVSLTTTLNGTFGNGAVVPGTGVFLNNEMDDFAVAPGTANLYELVQGSANEIRPGARPLSSMSPSVVERDGRPFLVVGSPGGSTIPTTVLQVILRATRGESLAAAVAAPRLHEQHLPDVVFAERGGSPKELVRELRSRGHAVRERAPIGQVHAIAFGAGGVLTGVADPRGGGAPAAP